MFGTRGVTRAVDERRRRAVQRKRCPGVLVTSTPTEDGRTRVLLARGRGGRRFPAAAAAAASCRTAGALRTRGACRCREYFPCAVSFPRRPRKTFTPRRAGRPPVYRSLHFQPAPRIGPWSRDSARKTLGAPNLAFRRRRRSIFLPADQQVVPLARYAGPFVYYRRTRRVGVLRYFL